MEMVNAFTLKAKGNYLLYLNDRKGCDETHKTHSVIIGKEDIFQKFAMFGCFFFKIRLAL